MVAVPTNRYMNVKPMYQYIQLMLKILIFVEPRYEKSQAFEEG
jgi:hypothetical protein